MNGNKSLYRYLGKLFQKNRKKTLAYLEIILAVTLCEMLLPLLTRDILDKGIGKGDM